MDDIIHEDSSDNYEERENLWDEQWPTTTEDRGSHPPDEPGNLDEELPFPDEVGTTDVISSVRDQEPFSPPTDPPVLPGGREAIHMATGFGRSPEEETSFEPQPRGDEDIRDEALLILRQDSETSTLSLDVDVDQGVVHLVGAVPSTMEAERAADLIGYVPGVIEVVDDTEVNPDVSG